MNGSAHESSDQSSASNPSANDRNTRTGISSNHLYEVRRSRLSDAAVNHAAEANNPGRSGIQYVGADTRSYERRMSRYDEGSVVRRVSSDANQHGHAEVDAEDKPGFYGADGSKYMGRRKKLNDVVDRKKGAADGIVFSGCNVEKFQKRCMKLVDAWRT